MTSRASGSLTGRRTGGSNGLDVLRFGVGLIVTLSLALAFAAPASAKTPKPKKPGAPTGLTAVGVEGGATFSWTAPASDGGSLITGYLVTVKNESCSTTGATTCTVTGLTDGRAYSAKVRAANAVGQGRASKSIRFTADQAPDCSNFVPGADLRYCPLANKDLDGVDLAGADLSGAKLNNTTFNGANLNDAIFDDSEVTTMASSNFDGAQMVGAELSGMNLDNGSFLNTNLTNADLDGANLNVDSFYGATMTGANLSDVFWNSDECPDGTMSNDDGNTCVNDLGPPS
jgi:Fibronectin type III domain/Pentapeptide repeats (8 copies)